MGTRQQRRQAARRRAKGQSPYPPATPYEARAFVRAGRRSAAWIMARARPLRWCPTTEGWTAALPYLPGICRRCGGHGWLKPNGRPIATRLEIPRYAA